MNAPRCGKHMRTVLLNCGPIAHLGYGGEVPMVGSLVEEVENLVSDYGGIVISDNTIECIAESSELASEYLTGEIGEHNAPSLIQTGSDTTVWNISGRAVIPGFVDAHTHLLWAGDRSREVMWRQRGLSYSEIRCKDYHKRFPHIISKKSKKIMILIYKFNRKRNSTRSFSTKMSRHHWAWLQAGRLVEDNGSRS